MNNSRQSLLFLAVGASMLTTGIYYESEIRAITQSIFTKLLGTAESTATIVEPEKLPAALKTEVDFILQQQAQKLTVQAPVEDELDVAENMQKLDDALTELERAEDEYDRELAVMTLGELGGAAAKQGLLTALRDNSDLVVNQAIRQINNWQDPSARTDLLLSALGNDNQSIVEQTLLTINVVDDKRLIARLKKLSKHNDSEIRAAAKLALNLAP